LLAEQLAKLAEIGQLRTQLPGVESFPHVDALLQQWDGGIELVDRRRDGLALGLLLRQLPVDLSALGPMLGRLRRQVIPVRLDQMRRGVVRRMEVRQRIVAVRERRVQPRRVELRRHEIALQAPQLGAVHGWIEFDQHLANFYGLAVADVDGAHHAGLERLDQLGATAGDDLARRRRHDVHGAPCRPAERQAEEADDGGADGAARRRCRCFDNLERRREERGLIVAAASDLLREPKDVLSRLHGCLPVGNAAWRSGRCCG
jgi:hypothetical protein